MKYCLVVMTVLGAAACQAPREVPAPVPARYHYSPFVVQVPQSSMVFDTITFKDVGLTRDSADPNDPLLETIAQSIAYEIQSAPELGVMQSSVEYVAEYSDPANHLSCETQHLYVDVWNRQDRWGYSLWSGCGEADNFAWEELVATAAVGTSLPDQVAPLAGSIAAKLVSAHQHKCFVKKC